MAADDPKVRTDSGRYVSLSTLRNLAQIHVETHDEIGMHVPRHIRDLAEGKPYHRPEDLLTSEELVELQVKAAVKNALEAVRRDLLIAAHEESFRARTEQNVARENLLLKLSRKYTPKWLKNQQES